MSRFHTGRCKAVIEGLFYQYVQKLEWDNEVDHGAVFINGTKLESRAGRYTFCWRGSGKHKSEQQRQWEQQSTLCEWWEKYQQARYEEVVADAGYESLDNYLYLEGKGQGCLIKPINHAQKKSGKFRKQIGRIENMDYNEQEDFFFCAQGHWSSTIKPHTQVND